MIHSNEVYRSSVSPWDWTLFSPDTLPTETRFQHRRPPHQRHRPLSSLLWYVWRPICRGENAWPHQCPAQRQDCPCRYTRFGRTIWPRCLRSSGERRRTKVPQPWLPVLLVSGGIQRWPQARLGHTRLRREKKGTVRGGDGDRHRRGWSPPSTRAIDWPELCIYAKYGQYSFAYPHFFFWGKHQLWGSRFEVGWCGVVWRRIQCGIAPTPGACSVWCSDAFWAWGIVNLVVGGGGGSLSKRNVESW